MSTELDPVIHSQIRLAVLSLLVGADEAELTFLREQTGATDGNLSIHLLKLEEAGYIAVDKSFVGRKPRSAYRLTPKGRKAFAQYVQNLKALLGGNLKLEKETKD